MSLFSPFSARSFAHHQSNLCVFFFDKTQQGQRQTWLRKRSTFGQRRKMLRTSLKQITSDPEALCHKAHIKSDVRADHLSPQDYLTLCKILMQ